MKTQEFMITMRDGVRLHTCVALPNGEGRFPVVLYRSRWSSINSLNSKRAQKFVSEGYAYVIQSARSYGKSEGPLIEDKYQGFDGYDTLRWLTGQSWCNGKVGTIGSSQLGEFQLRTALEGHPAHRAMCPQVPSYGNSNHHYGGSFIFPRTLINNARAKMEDYTQFDWMPYFYKLPVIDIIDKSDLDVSEKNKARFRKQIGRFSDNPANAAFKDPKHFKKFKKLNTPNLMVTGWYDHCSVATFEFYRHTMEYGTEKQKNNTHLVVGPWDHDSTPKNISEYDFGKTAKRDHQAAELTFFDRYLKNKSSDHIAPVRIFVMGKNKWRDEKTWPVDRAVNTNFYLHSDGNEAAIRGKLSTVPPKDETPDKFIYDPLNPVPTIGGANCGPSRALPMGRGPKDQRITLYRNDVLTYYSDVLEKPLEVTGMIKMVLFAASSAKDTDFTVKLMDIAPSGDARLLSDGIIRARFRNGLDNPKLLTPEKPVRYKIDLWQTSNEFQPGHRIGIAVSSSNFPRLPRNLNTGGDNVRDDYYVKANQTIFHDSTRPSHIILPVVKD